MRMPKEKWPVEAVEKIIGTTADVQDWRETHGVEFVDEANGKTIWGYLTEDDLWCVHYECSEEDFAKNLIGIVPDRDTAEHLVSAVHYSAPYPGENTA